eukprot:TRINITY_DN31171_c0_g1_i1.p2 TRINITY_DN31171_c0_g1~~TRINITY_DN31171_c0_g1_i1.p2  ORF type:complete len:290 (+),score=70.81 TRINITY_DN31171_c0_g1_i1:1496-2365(+)
MNKFKIFGQWKANTVRSRPTKQDPDFQDPAFEEQRRKWEKLVRSAMAVLAQLNKQKRLQSQLADPLSTVATSANRFFETTAQPECGTSLLAAAELVSVAVRDHMEIVGDLVANVQAITAQLASMKARISERDSALRDMEAARNAYKAALLAYAASVPRKSLSDTDDYNNDKAQQLEEKMLFYYERFADINVRLLQDLTQLNAATFEALQEQFRQFYALQATLFSSCSGAFKQAATVAQRTPDPHAVRPSSVNIWRDDWNTSLSAFVVHDNWVKRESRMSQLLSFVWTCS